MYMEWNHTSQSKSSAWKCW